MLGQLRVVLFTNKTELLNEFISNKIPLTSLTSLTQK